DHAGDDLAVLDPLVRRGPGLVQVAEVVGGVPDVAPLSGERVGAVGEGRAAGGRGRVAQRRARADVRGVREDTDGAGRGGRVEERRGAVLREVAVAGEAAHQVAVVDYDGPGTRLEHDGVGVARAQGVEGPHAVEVDHVGEVQARVGVV